MRPIRVFVCALLLLNSPLLSFAQQAERATLDLAAEARQQSPSSSVATTAVAQGAPSAGPVGDYDIYRIFFQHIENLDKGAARFEAQGKNGSEFRSYEQKKANLTDAEGEVMKRVAYDCNQAVAEVMAKRKAIMDALRAKYPHTPPYKIPALYNVPLPPELDQLNEQKRQIVLDHVAQLKSLLGDASFQKLDTWVHQRIHPQIIGHLAPGEKTSDLPPPISTLAPATGRKVQP